MARPDERLGRVRPGLDLVVDRVTMEPAGPTVREGARTMIYVKNIGNVPLPKGTAVPLTMRFEEKAGSGTPDRGKQ